MSKLIPNDTTLHRYVPQQVCAVKGETSLFEKIAHWLDSAEQWLFATFCPETVVDAILADKSLSALHTPLSAIAAHEAMINAIPSLDVVQTVNGFAVVSNQNLAPASKERVERLIASHRSARDRAICLLIPQLAKVESWHDTPQCGFFRASLIQPGQLRQIAAIDEWEKYLELRPKILAAENRLASDYISHELMQRLRDEALGITSPHSALHTPLCEALQSHIADLVREQPLKETALRDIVDYIRRHPDTFPEWHTSDVAKLFAPPVFENKKMSGGYWF